MIRLASFVAATAFSLSALADPVTFDFADPKGVNGVTFVMDSQLEPIVGTVAGVAGTVTYDPMDPASLSGHVSVDLDTISFVNPGMTKALKGPKWMGFDGSLPATVYFDSSALKDADDPDEPIVTVTGRVVLGDVEVPMTVDVSVAHHADAAKDRGGAESGDLLVLRSMFKLDRVALGINPDAPAEKVGPEIMVMVPVVGYSQ